MDMNPQKAQNKIIQSLMKKLHTFIQDIVLKHPLSSYDPSILKGFLGLLPGILLIKFFQKAQHFSI